MKPVPLDITRQGSLGGQVIPMTIDQSKLNKLMLVLTDLYSDPIAAFIREYSTNARDAHIDAGKSDVAIEVSLPNSLSPYFRVRDFGKGMSVDFIENVYSSYLTSSKEETNDLVGYLGLGSKSGLTYCAQFRVVSIHNGVKAQVMVSRNESGSSEMEVVDTSATDEPSGVEIIIPVHNAVEVNRKAQDFYQFWMPGTVLIDGEPSKFIGDNENALWVEDDIIVLPGSGTSHVVMGNVPYKAEGLTPYYADYRTVAFVPIGSVSFPPNREELMYTEATKRTIEDYKERTTSALHLRIQEEIDKSENYVEALKAQEKWSDILDGTWTYKGETLDGQWNYNHKDYPDLAKFYPTHERHAVSHPNWLSWKDFSTHLTITGFTGDKVNTPLRQKIRKYVATLNPKPYMVYLTEEHPDAKKLPDIRTVHIDTIKAVKLDKVARGDGKMKKFTTINQYGYHIEKDELDSTKGVLYIVPGRRKIKWRDLAGLLDDWEIVSLYKSEMNKLLKTHPGAEDLEIYVKDKLGIAKASLSMADKMAVTEVDYYSRNLAAVLDVSEIDDPEVVTYIEFINKRKSRSDEMIEYNHAVKCAQAVGQYIGEVEAIVVEDPFDKYPLAKYHYNNVEHVTLYMNAVYAHQKEKDNQV